ncbi:hypothetical protein GBA52_014628 [Prunus armeniaca]|nr:hypothetical protein GBA52_014628 [Prunus armeniaca]
MWKLDIPSKVKIFAWMLIRIRLQVRARLHKFMPHISPNYPCCQNQLETIQHLFMDCNFAKDVWGCSFYLWPPPSQATDLYCWLSALGCSTPKSDLDLLSKALLICLANLGGYE